MNIDESPIASQNKALRPLLLADFHGQPAISEQLSIFIQAARARDEVLDHVLLYGPPGLGKTTLAHIIANEMEGELKTSSGPLLQKPLDLVPLLVGLTHGSVLFIDEIHRMTIQAEEILYSAMEDGFIDIMIDGETEKKSVRVQLESFTLIGATTRSGSLSAPLRDRFGITFRLQYYRLDDLVALLETASRSLGMKIPRLSNKAIAMRSRGTPRIALKLLRRVRDYLEARDCEGSTGDIESALALLGISDMGLDEQDVAYLKALVVQFSGGPVGLNTMATALGEDAGTLEGAVEPYLIQEGFIQRTSRGRVAMDKSLSLIEN